MKPANSTRTPKPLTRAFLATSQAGYQLEERFANPVRLRVTFPSMNPIPSRQIGRPSKIHRRVFCKLYDLCLEKAIAENWEGFACHQCTKFAFEPAEDLYWLEQGERAGELLNTIFFRKIHRASGTQAPRSARGNMLRNPLETIGNKPLRPTKRKSSVVPMRPQIKPRPPSINLPDGSDFFASSLKGLSPDERELCLMVFGAW